MSDMLLKAPLTYEPLRNNRWLIRFPSDLGIMEWTLATAARPNLTQNETEMQFINTSTWVLGRYIWETLEITIRDMIGPSGSQAIMEWVRLGTESVTGRQGYAAGYKRDVEIEMLDPTGVVVQKWILKNTMITNVNFGALDYSDDNIATITATLRYDYAILCY
jgi:hypothetical protein